MNDATKGGFRGVRRHVKGVFCLEGEWNESLKKTSSVKPILELLRQWAPYHVPSIHRNVATSDELRYYLDKWLLKTYADHPILYLAFHGDPGTIYIGEQHREESHVTLDVMEDALAGRCGGRVIYFGACATLDVHGNRLNRFLKETGALAVCGYRQDVGWLRATAFELLVFAAMQDNALTIGGATAMKRRITREAGTLAKELRFRMVIRRAE
ncbi:MAG: hypothetical protein GC159_19490 [Phycisphaera sp.]|nr:hypothetical protein [Phycisphaera sp.]